MESTVKNSHYIAKHLTDPWTFADRRKGPGFLWYYDFDRDDFDEKPQKKLYALAQPLSGVVERFFRNRFETPLSALIHKLKGSNQAQPSEVQLRALKFIFFFQKSRAAVLREEQGRPEDAGARARLELLCTKNEKWLNNGLSLLDELYEFAFVRIGGNLLFYPETGVFEVPLLDDPALALPILPDALLAAVPRRHPKKSSAQSLERFRKDQLRLVEASVGSDSCRRVVIPGSHRGKISAEQVRTNILELRRRASRRSRLYAAARKMLLAR